METAIYWPKQYLAQRILLMRAVNAVALAYALDHDCGWVARKRGGYADTWRERYEQGCNVIARGLCRNRLPVF
jgi:hypothetical protein